MSGKKSGDHRNHGKNRESQKQIAMSAAPRNGQGIATGMNVKIEIQNARETGDAAIGRKTGTGIGTVTETVTGTGTESGAATGTGMGTTVTTAVTVAIETIGIAAEVTNAVSLAAVMSTARMGAPTGTETSTMVATGIATGAETAGMGTATTIVIADMGTGTVTAESEVMTGRLIDGAMMIESTAGKTMIAEEMKGGKAGVGTRRNVNQTSCLGGTSHDSVAVELLCHRCERRMWTGFLSLDTECSFI